MKIGQLYKGHMQDGTATGTEGYDFITASPLNNFTISGNTFIGGNVQNYLWLQGATNVTHDLTDYWYVKTWMNVNFTDVDEFYNNNAFDRLSIVPGSLTGETYVFTKSTAGMYNPDYDLINYSIGKSLLKFWNNNGLIENGTIYNLTSPNMVFNSSTSTPAYQNEANIKNPTIASSQRIFIIEYTAGQPYPSQIDTTVTDIEYSASSSSVGMTLVGIGNAELIGLSIYVSAGGYYEVVRNGVTYSYETTDTYSLPSPGVFV